MNTAIPSLLWCLVWWWAVEEDPRDAKWLDPAVKEQLVAELEAEARTHLADGERLWLAMWHPTVIILSIYNLLGLTALWGLTFWLPTLIVEQGRRIGMAGLLAAIGFVGESHITLLLICASLTFGLWFGRITIYWIMVADAVPKGCAGPSMALANGVGNLGGFVGPWMFGLLRGYYGGFNSSILCAGALYIAAGLVATTVRMRSTSQTIANRIPSGIDASLTPGR